jgi:hypothetical protein
MNEIHIKQHIKLILEQELSNIKITAGLEQQVAKFGDKNNIYKIKLIDQRPGKSNKNIILKYGNDGSLKASKDINEGFVDKLMVGLTCTILATGAVSCKKDQTGFGFNITPNVKSYRLGNNSNKEINIITPSGERKIQVDSTDFKQVKPSSGAYLSKYPTPYELQVLAFGQAMTTEERFNNGKGYDPNKLAMDVESVDINRQIGYEQAEHTTPIDIEDHQLFIDGKKYINKYSNQWEIFKKDNPLSKFEL